MQCVYLPVISLQMCQDLYPRYGVSQQEMCTLSLEGKGVCSGDSGGPLLCASMQTGIVSWGKKCGVPTNPCVYVRVDYYLEFINSYKNSQMNVGKSLKYFRNNYGILLICIIYVLNWIGYVYLQSKFLIIIHKLIQILSKSNYWLRWFGVTNSRHTIAI